YRQQILVGVRPVERVDPHPEPLARMGIEKGRNGLARFRPGRGGNRHLEGEDKGVGARFQRLLHPVRPVAGNEQERAQSHRAPRFIRAVRSITQTSSSRWLYMRCSKVTMPASGRDFESLRPTTSVSARSVSPMKTGLGMRTLS